MKIKCPKCGEELEMPDGMDGCHLQCSYCNAKFIAVGGKGYLTGGSQNHTNQPQSDGEMSRLGADSFRSKNFKFNPSRKVQKSKSAHLLFTAATIVVIALVAFGVWMILHLANKIPERRVYLSNLTWSYYVDEHYNHAGGKKQESGRGDVSSLSDDELLKPNVAGEDFSFSDIEFDAGIKTPDQIKEFSEINAAFQKNDFALGARLLKNVSHTNNAVYCFYNGILAEKLNDLKGAHRWFQQTANEWCKEALFNLGVYYEFGMGARKDLELASGYYQRAAIMGDKEAQKRYESIARQKFDVAKLTLVPISNRRPWPDSSVCVKGADFAILRDDVGRWWDVPFEKIKEFWTANTSKVDGKFLFKRKDNSECYIDFVNLNTSETALTPLVEYWDGWQMLTQEATDEQAMRNIMLYLAVVSGGKRLDLLENNKLWRNELAAVMHSGDVSQMASIYKLMTKNLLLEYDQSMQVVLGYKYEFGAGVVKDEAEAARWYRKAAGNGSAIGECRLGNLYYDGRGVEKNYVEACRWYHKAAEQGEALAQFQLGFMYSEGVGVAKDCTEAFKWYRKAAEQEVAGAQFCIGRMYQLGNGVQMDYAEALRWYRKSAEQGNASAQFNLGIMYSDGCGVPIDEAESAKWYRKAADQGYSAAQFNLANMYLNGQGVRKDVSEAAKWYRKAAEHGDATAQFNLGVMYHCGEGVLKDYNEALMWYRKAADQGYATAQHNIGVMYENGDGVGKNNTEAIYWFDLAAKQGYRPSEEAIRRINDNANAKIVMREEQVADTKDYNQIFSALYDRFKNAFVSITAGNSVGSGFLVSGYGGIYMYTNKHVMEGGRPFYAKLIDGSSLKFDRLQIAEGFDLARCRVVNASAVRGNTLEIRPDIPKMGEEIAVVGDSGGIGVQTLLQGKIIGVAIGQRVYEVSAEFIPGNSGSPVLDNQGKVLGVASFGYNSHAAGDWATKDTRFDKARRFFIRLDGGLRWKNITFKQLVNSKK